MIALGLWQYCRFLRSNKKGSCWTRRAEGKSRSLSQKCQHFLNCKTPSCAHLAGTVIRMTCWFKCAARRPVELGLVPTGRPPSPTSSGCGSADPPRVSRGPPAPFPRRQEWLCSLHVPPFPLVVLLWPHSHLPKRSFPTDVLLQMCAALPLQRCTCTVPLLGLI